MCVVVMVLLPLPRPLDVAPVTFPSSFEDPGSPNSPVLLRFTRLRLPSSRLLDFAARVRFFDDIVASVVSLDELVFYQDAATDPCWVSAMQQEMDSIHANKTYTLVDLPPGQTPIYVKWVYKLKSSISGTL